MPASKAMGTKQIQDKVFINRATDQYFCCLTMIKLQSWTAEYFFSVFSLTISEIFSRLTASQIYPKMFSTDFIFRQQENLVDNQKCQAGFRPLCNKILFLISNARQNSRLYGSMIQGYARQSNKSILKFMLKHILGWPML